MSDREGLLARWSRRKRAAAQGREPGLPQPEQTAAEGSAVEAEPVIDLADLPPLDSIGPGSDIRAFLMPGVPPGVSRAALRRAWSADPAIRDFIGLSENSWDFTAPGGVPGFGALTAEDAKRLLDRLAGDPEAADAAPPESDQAPTMPASDASEGPGCDAKKGNADRVAVSDEIAAQPEAAARDALPPPTRQRHGGALPE